MRATLCTSHQSTLPPVLPGGRHVAWSPNSRSRRLALLHWPVASQDLVRMTITPSWPVQIDDHVRDWPALQDCPDPQLLQLLQSRLGRGWCVEGRGIADSLGSWCLGRICIQPCTRLKSRGGGGGGLVTRHRGDEGEGRSQETRPPLLAGLSGLGFFCEGKKGI